MAAVSGESENLHFELKTKKICRFCLSQQTEELTNLYTPDGHIHSTAPLPLQIMACFSIEIFSDDGLPAWICFECLLLFEHAYQFKKMCKKAELLLRLYPFTGQWPEVLAKPKFSEEFFSKPAEITQSTPSVVDVTPLNSQLNPIKDNSNEILDSDPISSPEPPLPVRVKMEAIDEEAAIFLNKVENNVELSIDDVQRLVAATDDADEFLSEEEEEEEEVSRASPNESQKPELLVNKSPIRKHNNSPEAVSNLCPSVPRIKSDENEDVIEILEHDNPEQPESDPIKNTASADVVHAGDKSIKSTTVRPYPCTFCGKSYSLPHHLARHLCSHKLAPTSYTCRHCDKTYKTRNELIYHSAVHATQSLVCPLCMASFDSTESANSHIKQHAETEAYVCEFCDLIFITSDALQTHTGKDHIENLASHCENENIRVSNAASIEEETLDVSNQSVEDDIVVKIDESDFNGDLIDIHFQSVEDDIVVKIDESDFNGDLTPPPAKIRKAKRVVTSASTTSIQIESETKPNPSSIKIEPPEECRSLSADPKHSISDALATCNATILRRKRTKVVKKIITPNASGALASLIKTIPKDGPLKLDPKENVLKTKVGNKTVTLHTVTIARPLAETLIKKGHVCIVDGKMLIKKFKIE